MKITIIDRVGTVPVLATSPAWATSDDTFNFDKQVFEENPTWKWFIRYAAPFELAQMEPGADPNREFYFLIHRAFPGCRTKQLISRPYGRPLDHFDEEAVRAAQGSLLQHAKRSNGVRPANVSNFQRSRVAWNEEIDPAFQLPRVIWTGEVNP